MNQEEEKYLSYSRYAASDPNRFHQDEPGSKKHPLLWCALALLVLCICALLWYFKPFGLSAGLASKEASTESELSEAVTEAYALPVYETEEPETEETVSFSPHAVSGTEPAELIEYTEIEYNGSLISSADLNPWYDIHFGTGDTYTDVDGIVTFRGSHFRDMPALGTTYMSNHTAQTMWSQSTGALSYNGTTWSGSGWTGQPLIERWSRQMKQHMNMYDWAKEDDDLVEVIYACMDGYIYFLNLVTGQATRDPLYIGYTFKGAGSLDPRGYPILYVGAGYDSTQGTARVFVISLLDGSILYTFGNSDSFSLRGNLSYFDSSPLVDAESDTLIYPGENGILYLIHLGTSYDEEAGTLSVDPDQTLKWHYSGIRTSSASYWVGMEDSCAVYDGYLYIADNGGNLMCLNLNTLELVWVQDTLDDTNSTPVLSLEDGRLYLYISTSFRLGWRSSSSAVIPVWKIDAETGEIIWQKDYECYTQDGVSGGVQSTIAVGQNQLDDRIFVTVSMVGSTYSGVLACLDKETGEVRWEHNAGYAWSSPVCVYDPQGEGEVIYADSTGTLYLVNADTGETYSTVSLSDGVIEASPAVYRNYLVIGTRASKIWGLQLS